VNEFNVWNFRQLDSVTRRDAISLFSKLMKYPDKVFQAAMTSDVHRIFVLTRFDADADRHVPVAAMGFSNNAIFLPHLNSISSNPAESKKARGQLKRPPSVELVLHLRDALEPNRRNSIMTDAHPDGQKLARVMTRYGVTHQLLLDEFDSETSTYSKDQSRQYRIDLSKCDSPCRAHAMWKEYRG